MCYRCRIWIVEHSGTIEEWNKIGSIVKWYKFVYINDVNNIK